MTYRLTAFVVGLLIAAPAQARGHVALRVLGRGHGNKHREGGQGVGPACGSVSRQTSLRTGHVLPAATQRLLS